MFIPESHDAAGEPILPGEIARGLIILGNGGDMDHVGATAVEFDDKGESGGSCEEQEIRGGKYVVAEYR